MKNTTKLLALMLGLFLVIGCGDKKTGDGEADKSAATGEKIKLDFHIMSKCPFGVKVMQAISPVLEKMGDNVDFKVNYIGREKDGSPTSMHGEPEIKGDTLQLCAAEHGTFEQWLNFVKCQNEDWHKIPEGWEKCADSAKIDKAQMKKCFEGDEGKKLLLASFGKSKEKKATGSPTIFLNGEPYRGGRSEASFGRALCAKFEGSKPKYCADIPAPIKVPVTVVADKRCQGRGCDPKRFLAFVSHTFEGAEIKELDYSDTEGKALFEKTGEKFLPVAIFGASVEKVEAGYKRLKRRMKKIEGSDEQVYPLGREWDPTAEICDDGKDNTGNGKVDCDDESCKSKKVCREEIKKKVNLFVMSHCPYGVRTVDAMEGVLKNFKNDRANMDFHIDFIGRNVDGKLTSMHGETEVNENLRQICAQKYYPKKYKFMEYVLCRNKMYQENRGKEPEGNEWEACAKGQIKANVIKKCAEGSEGQELLAASYKLAEDLGISGSPNWLLNNRFDMNGRSPEQIKTVFCAKNEGVSGCENTLTVDTGKPVPAGSCGGGPAPKVKAVKVAPKVEKAAPKAEKAAPKAAPAAKKAE